MSNQSVASEVIEALRSHGFNDEAEALEQQVSNLSSSNEQERLKARNTIVSMAHPRWLGDLYLDRVTLKDWWSMLEAMAQRVKATDGS